MRKLLLAAIAVVPFLAAPVSAAVVYNTSLVAPPGTFFGTGNPNTHWTVNTTLGVELGLQATAQSSPAITPVLNVYTAFVGLSTGVKSKWNFNFSFNGAGAGRTMADLSALNLTVTDVTQGSTFTQDLLTIIADNEGNSVSGPEHHPAIGTDTSVQNSENLGFAGIKAAFDPGFNAYMPDTYNFTLEAICSAAACGSVMSLGSVSITVETIPEPASFAILGLGLTGLVMLRRRSSSGMLESRVAA